MEKLPLSQQKEIEEISLVSRLMKITYEEVCKQGIRDEDNSDPVKSKKNGRKVLHRDFPIDSNNSNVVVDLGDTYMLVGNSQNSMCNVMSGIKLKGVGRPKGRELIEILLRQTNVEYGKDRGETSLKMLSIS